MSDIVTFGEIMLRLTTPGYMRFAQADMFHASYGGAEANVAVSLAGFGMNSFFVTRLPDNDVGEAALQNLRKFGVNTSYVLRGGNRLGIYYEEAGSSLRSAKVTYDRSGSSISQIEPDAVDWQKLFKGKDWFHWSGITPAIGSRPAEALKQACKAAKDSGLTISCDLNYRAKLWTPDQAQRVMIPLMEHVDVCIANEEHVAKCLNLDTSAIGNTADRLENSRLISLALKNEFGFQSVAMTLRETFTASKGAWSAVFHDDMDCKDPVQSKRYTFDIVDRVGAGDAFAAGLIYGLLTMDNSRQAFEFGAAACGLKHSIPGDYNLVTADEVKQLVLTGGGADVAR